MVLAQSSTVAKLTPLLCKKSTNLSERIGVRTYLSNPIVRSGGKGRVARVADLPRCYHIDSDIILPRCATEVPHHASDTPF